MRMFVVLMLLLLLLIMLFGCSRDIQKHTIHGNIELRTLHRSVDVDIEMMSFDGQRFIVYRFGSGVAIAPMQNTPEKETAQ